MLSLLQAPPSTPGSVPGVSDTAAVVIGTVLTLLVIYAILAAHLRSEGGLRRKPRRDGGPAEEPRR